MAPAGTFTINGAGTSIHLNDLPDQTRGVTGVQTYWYIRVKKGGTWSTVYVGNGSNQTLNAVKLTIGTPPLVCGQGSSSGNFGTLLLSTTRRTTAGTRSGAANVALGLTNTLAIYPAGGPADGTCSSSQTTTVLWNADGTNCVDTDTGMSANVATGGFLGLGSSAVGGTSTCSSREAQPPCGAGRDAEATTVLKGQSINNDVLTCFFTSTTTHISDVDNATYAGGPLISSAIYDSPRFGYVPVLQGAARQRWQQQVPDRRLPALLHHRPGAVLREGRRTGFHGQRRHDRQQRGQASIQVIFLNGNALPIPPVKNGTVELHRHRAQGPAARQLTVPDPLAVHNAASGKPFPQGPADRAALSVSPSRLLPRRQPDGRRRATDTAPSRASGSYGETLAARHLTGTGMVLLERNWSTTTGEIDLLLREGDVLVVCEVKTRTSDACGLPHEAVDNAKVERLRRVADEWLAAHAADPRDVRVDLVAVTRPRKGPSVVEHVRGIG